MCGVVTYLYWFSINLHLILRKKINVIGIVIVQLNAQLVVAVMDPVCCLLLFVSLFNASELQFAP